MTILLNQSKKKTKRKNSGRKSRSPLTKEILALLLFAVGVMSFLAIVSYHQTDPVSGLSDENLYKIRNLLGLAGAIFSHYVFQWTFGFPSVVFPIILLFISLGIFLKYSLKKIVMVSTLLLLWAYLFSVALALPAAIESMGHFLDYYPSGFIGGISASLLVRVFNKFASVFIWVVALLILSTISFKIRLSWFPRLFALLVQKLLNLLKLLAAGIASLGVRLIHYPVAKLREAARAKRERSRRKWARETARESTETPALAAEPFPEKSAPAAPLEIITREDERDSSAATEQNLPQVKKEADGSGSAAVKPPPGPGPNFEIEEAVQEKELDYDSLVRNSLARYQFPSTDILDEDGAEVKVPREELMAKANLLEKTLAQFGVKARVKRVVEGPVITLYVVQPAEGVKINQIATLADDLALALRAEAIRIIAPLPGEAAIGIEIPNQNRSLVHFRSIVRSEKFIHAPGNLVLGMGKTISGEVFCDDLTRLPHLLVAGATGSGKSVGINTMIASILYRVPPSDVKFVLIDPKKLELSIYAKLKDHYLAYCPELDEIVVTHPQNAILILRSVVNEMEERYDKLVRLGARDIVAFNEKVEKYRAEGETSEEFRRLPYIIVIIDELADLILTAAREVEEPITRLAQMARAVGIHLIVATQRPSVDILTGLIKANFPARIAYQVATRPDSKVILDMYGAEKLIGSGDMLFLPPGTLKPIRLQSPLISTEEIERIIRHIRKQPKFPPYKLRYIRERKSTGPGSPAAFAQDEYFEAAKKIVIRHQQGSISLLQRKLQIGYARAARLIDALEEAGVVGPGQGSKARDVLISSLNDEENK